MRLIFVHGINNQGGSGQAIIAEWLTALSQTLPPGDMAIIRKAEIVAPYYGDILYNATKGGKAAPPISLGTGDVPDEQAHFYLDAMEEFAAVEGVSEAAAQIAANALPVEMGMPHNRRLNALLRCFEHISPNKGKLLLHLLPQAFAYLYRPIVANAVDTVVGPALAGERCVVVGHSLGTVVTYKLLREKSNITIPFYLTLGSPLALKAVQNALGPAFEKPDIVSKWLNGLDPSDVVTIGRALNEDTFGIGVENIADIDNGKADAHDITMYLRDKRVAEAILMAVSGKTIR